MTTASLIRAIALMEAARTTETSVKLYQTTQRNNGEGIDLHKMHYSLHRLFKSYNRTEAC
jgi:hypothetical protein